MGTSYCRQEDGGQENGIQNIGLAFLSFMFLSPTFLSVATREPVPRSKQPPDLRTYFNNVFPLRLCAGIQTKPFFAPRRPHPKT
jgi:hypothetical protein